MQNLVVVVYHWDVFQDLSYWHNPLVSSKVYFWSDTVLFIFFWRLPFPPPSFCFSMEINCNWCCYLWKSPYVVCKWICKKPTHHSADWNHWSRVNCQKTLSHCFSSLLLLFNWVKIMSWETSVMPNVVTLHVYVIIEVDRLWTTQLAIPE